MELLAEDGTILEKTIYRPGKQSLTRVVLDILAKRGERFMGSLSGENEFVVESIVEAKVVQPTDGPCPYDLSDKRHPAQRR